MLVRSSEFDGYVRFRGSSLADEILRWTRIVDGTGWIGCVDRSVEDRVYRLRLHSLLQLLRAVRLFVSRGGFWSILLRHTLGWIVVEPEGL